MELLIGLILAAVFLVLMVVMLILGYKESLKTKVEDPFAYHNFLIGEGWERDTFVEYEEIIDILGREPSDDETKIFLDLVEEGYHGEVLLKKFLEKINKSKHH